MLCNYIAHVFEMIPLTSKTEDWYYRSKEGY